MDSPVIALQPLDRANDRGLAVLPAVFCRGCIAWHHPDRVYYVSVKHGPKHAFLLGPYATHADALANVRRGAQLAEGVDLFAHFYAFGTCSLPLAGRQPVPVFGGET